MHHLPSDINEIGVEDYRDIGVEGIEYETPEVNGVETYNYGNDLLHQSIGSFEWLGRDGVKTVKQPENIEIKNNESDLWLAPVYRLSPDRIPKPILKCQFSRPCSKLAAF